MCPQLFSRLRCSLTHFSFELLRVITLRTEKAPTLLLAEMVEGLGYHVIISPVFPLLYFLFWAKLHTAHLAGLTNWEP